jgi:putative acetyltransferase
MLQIFQANASEAVGQATALFREYAASLSVDLAFQNFERELAELPGEYAPPEGRLLLAFLRDSEKMPSSAQPHAAGCVALRKMDATSCEMKRLYLRPKFRGHGVGRALAEEAIKAAREIGYQRMRLDTLPEMAGAQILYESLGFREIPPYRFNPIPGTRYLELTLS